MNDISVIAKEEIGLREKTGPDRPEKTIAFNAVGFLTYGDDGQKLVAHKKLPKMIERSEHKLNDWINKL